MSEPNPIPKRLFIGGATLVLCSFLGFFNACTVSVTQPFAKWDVVFEAIAWLFLASGPLVGLFLIRNRRISRMQLHRLHGAAWIVSAVVTFLAGTVAIPRANLTPVRLPIRFDRPNSVQATFTAEESAPYFLTIVLDAKLYGANDKTKHKTQEVMLQDAVKTPPLIEGYVTEKAGGTVKVELGFRDNDVETYLHRAVVSEAFGKWRAVRGRTYHIAVRVNRPAAKLHSCRPYLEVQPAFYVQHDRIIKGSMLVCGSLFALVIGAMLMTGKTMARIAKFLNRD